MKKLFSSPIVDQSDEITKMLNDKSTKLPDKPQILILSSGCSGNFFKFYKNKRKNFITKRNKIFI
jgi:hypothetical protein